MIKKLAGSVREYKKPSILAALYVFMEVLTDVAIPFTMALLIDEGIEKGSMKSIMWIGLVLVVCCLCSLIFGILSGNSAAVASSGFAKNLRKDLFGNIQKFSFENIDKFSTASLITRLTTDVTNIQNAYQMIIRTAVRAPLMMIFAIIMSFAIRPELAMIYLIVVPFVGGGLYMVIKFVHPLFERVFRTYDKLNRIVQENVHGIRVVKSFVQEDAEIDKFTGVSSIIYKDFTRAEKILSFNSPILQSAVYICMLVISWIGAKLIVGGDMSTGDLMSLVFYTMQILMSLILLSMVFVMIVISRAGAERSIEILEESSTLKNSENPVSEIKNTLIEFKDVSFAYKSSENMALSGVNLTIQPGSTVGIIGGTGSAKTSLVQLIPRLYDITSGSLTIGGIPVDEYDMVTLRDAVGMVLQKNVLFSGTIIENLRWGNENATLDDIKLACEQAQAAPFIENFPDKYESYIEQGGANLSGGQRQRLCIARALLKQPKILIMDDSTSAVDTKTDAFIRKGLRQNIPETTQIIIAQRVASIEDADQIVVLEEGVVNGVGTHAQLMENNKIYREVYRSQTQGRLA